MAAMAPHAVPIWVIELEYTLLLCRVLQTTDRFVLHSEMQLPLWKLPFKIFAPEVLYFKCAHSPQHLYLVLVYQEYSPSMQCN